MYWLPNLAEVFRNGPYSGTAWVCGGEYFELNKKTRIYELYVTNTCECFNNYRLRWLMGPSMLVPRNVHKNKNEKISE